MNDLEAIQVGMKWQDEPGDRSKCCNCGEESWLTMTRMLLVIEGTDYAQDDIVLCLSCAEVVRK